MKVAIISDFDGTITTKDVGDFLLLHFNLATEKEIEDSYEFGLKIEEWMKKYFSRIKSVNLAQVKRAIKEHIKLRDGFCQMVEFLNRNLIPFEVVSGGVDLYIEEVFENYGLKLKGYYGKFNNGDISFDFLNKDKALSDFKMERVLLYKKLGYKTIFCGDAPNDYKAAVVCDICFATLRLAEIMRKENRDFFYLNDFKKVMEVLNVSLS
ncbi:MAG: HAD-IB family phosphatase [Elusimicrobiota bacterium]